MLFENDSRSLPDIRSRFASALDNGHIWPAFQPITDIRSGALRGFEVLARWTDPETGNLSPSDFIPELEEHDLIGELFNHLVRSACPVAATWPGRFFLAFNLSPKQLVGKGMPLALAKTVRATGFPLDRFQVEITEGSLIPDVESAYANLHALDDMGIKVALDDFGTGYSSLARLEAFPFRKLKIDARFVRALHRDSSKRRIAAAIIGLGQSLGITVVAEGVETLEEESVLRELGCDLGQGWLYGKAVASEQARRMTKAFPSANDLARPLDASPFQQFHQLATLYRQAPVGLCFVDLEHRHVRANDRFAAIHNMVASQLEGKTIYDVMSGKTLNAVKQVFARSITSDEPIIETYIKADRHYHIFCTRVLDVAGEIIGFSVVSADTQSPSERCRHLLEDAHELGVPYIRVCPACSTGARFHESAVGH